MKLSRQRLWQLRHASEGLCKQCSEPVWRKGSMHCLKHIVLEREYRRAHLGCKRRYKSASYAEQGAKK